MNARAKLEIGSTLGGRFQILSEIGEGGFGKIYRARQLNIDRDVALKVLPPRFASMDNVVERFRREARLASRLQHPNTITIHDYGQEDGHFYIAMEYLRGEDLGHRIHRERRIPFPTALHIARQTLQSLKEAHHVGIVHRDLKPENIFLTQLGDDENFVKVLDFGIATMAGLEVGEHLDKDRRRLTVQGSTVGTPAYMSPEQAAGESVGPRSDIYTLGLILFEMINGQPPFFDDRPVRVMRAHLFDPVPAFLNKDLQDTRFEALVRKALQKKPEDRFQTAAEFCEALSEPDLEQKSRSFSSPTLLSTPAHPRDEIPFESIPSFPESDDRPPGFGFSLREESITSSIITVLEEPAPEEVIILTDLKAREEEKAIKEVEETSESTPLPASSRSEETSLPIEEWSWSQDLARTDASGSQILTDLKPENRKRTILLGMILLVIALLAGLLTWGLY